MLFLGYEAVIKSSKLTKSFGARERAGMRELDPLFSLGAKGSRKRRQKTPDSAPQDIRRDRWVNRIRRVGWPIDVLVIGLACCSAYVTIHYLVNGQAK